MPRKAPVPPPRETVDRIKREVAAPGFLSDLITWADRQCGKLLSIEDRIDRHKAIELVNAAVVDTCDGVRVWHPGARPLRRHLEQTVNSRLWHECERARRRRFLALGPVNPDDSQDRAAALEIEVSERREDPRTRPDMQLAQREVRAKVFRALRHEAGRVTTDARSVGRLWSRWPNGIGRGDPFRQGHGRMARRPGESSSESCAQVPCAAGRR